MEECKDAFVSGTLQLTDAFPVAIQLESDFTPTQEALQSVHAHLVAVVLARCALVFFCVVVGGVVVVVVVFVVVVVVVVVFVQQ